MSIASILSTKGADVVTAAPDTPVQDIVELLHRHRIGAVLVVSGEVVAGVVSERDVVRCLQVRGTAVLNARAEEVMTTPVVSVSSDESILQALSMMTERRIRHLPVLDSGRLVGLVSIGDLVKRRIEMIEAEAGALKDYIQMA